MSMNNYDWLISSLDAFIRKYYANKVIRGTLIFLSCLLAYVLLVSVGEYYFYLPVWARLGILSVFVILGAASLVSLIIIPLAKMSRLGKVISYEQAAGIIGEHFTEISDKLLNILQLKNQDAGIASRELAEASINQKIGDIRVLPIASAIDLSKNKKYLPFLLPVLLAGVFLLVAAPNVFTEGSSRLLQPTRAFEKPAPFKFLVGNKDLVAVRNADFLLKIEVTGNLLPAEVFIEANGEKVPMQVLENHHFQYAFKNVTASTPFRFYAAGFYSTEYTLKVVQKPVLKAFKVQLNYPAYTGKKNETRNSLSDMTLPVGTTVNWLFYTEHTDAAAIQFGSGAATSLNNSSSTYSYQYRFLNDTAYTITLRNNQSTVTDSYRYQVQVIPDQYPVIQLEQHRDTVTGKQILVTGTVGDDYSIARASFNYEITDNNRSVGKKNIALKITPGALCAFEQYFDVGPLNLQPGQKVTYYIEAWDNDGVHGSKSSRSEVMSYQMFDAKQIDSAINENAQQINSGLSNSAQKSKQLQTDYKDMQSKMLQSDNVDWDQQLNLQEMMKKQLELKNQIETVKQHFDEQVQQSEQKKYSEDVKDKQKELQKQMDNLLNAELKEQMKKLQEMMQKLNKDQAVEAMKQMEQENKLFKMDMERMQALMSKLEQQMRMEDMANKMDDLAKKENALNKETETGKKDAAELSKEQEKLKNELDKAVKEDMKEIDKLAQKTKKEEGLDDAKKNAEDAKKEMDESQKELEKKENSKASKPQKDAAKNLEQMAKSLRKSASGMSPEEIEIDIRATRQILSNLIRMSFDQEALMAEVRRTSTSAQAYITNQEEQNRLHTNSYMIRDSLFALSKRIPKLPPVINKATTDLERHLQQSVDALENRNVGGAITNEQYVMTYTNNLALILNEILSNLMQSQNQSGEPGAGSCSKPGGKKPSPGPGKQLSDIITEQEQLGNAMQQMQKKMGQKPGDKPGDKQGGDKEGNKPGDKPGQKPGGKSPGKDGENGSGGGGSGEGNEGENENSEQLARLAEQQASIRRKIQELSSLLNSKGMNGNSKELRELEGKMDKTETDLVNRRFSAEMMQRQRDILTRLLEAEKSLREQEQDDKRSSKTPDEISRPIPPMLQKYLTDQKQLLEFYKTVPPQLKPYYKEMVEQYFRIIGTH